MHTSVTSHFRHLYISILNNLAIVGSPQWGSEYGIGFNPSSTLVYGMPVTCHSL